MTEHLGSRGEPAVSRKGRGTSTGIEVYKVCLGEQETDGVLVSFVSCIIIICAIYVHAKDAVKIDGDLSNE